MVVGYGVILFLNLFVVLIMYMLVFVKDVFDVKVFLVMLLLNY